MIAVIGFDPGATAGAALVAVPRGDDHRPRCLAAASIAASRSKKRVGPARRARWELDWYERALVVLHRLRAQVPDRRLAEVTLVIEVPNDERSCDAYSFGLARQTERLALACQAVFGRRPEPVTQGTWVDFYGDLPIAKQGDGTHRIEEAAAHVVGARELLEKVTAGHRVDVAEAVLLAAAVLQTDGVAS